MTKRLLGGLLLLASCGKQVSIDHTALENASKAQNAYSSQKDAYITKSGSLLRMASSERAEIIYNSNRYKVSEYSSLITKNFIKNLPSGASVSVTFKGSLMSSEMVITEIAKR